MNNSIDDHQILDWIDNATDEEFLSIGIHWANKETSFREACRKAMVNAPYLRNEKSVRFSAKMSKMWAKLSGLFKKK